MFSTMNRNGLNRLLFFLYPVFIIGITSLWVACSGKNDPTSPSQISTVIIPKVDTVRMILAFSGDFMQHIPQVNSARIAKGDFDYASTLVYMEPFFEKADFSILNFETTLSETGYSGYPRFRSPKACMPAIRNAGINVLAMANNHCCDNGREGIEITLQTADSCGMLHTGVFRDSADYKKRNPLFLTKGNLQVALLNYTYGTNGLPVPAGTVVNLIDTARIAADFSRARQLGATDIVVMYHWGEEYTPHPHASQKRLAEWTHQQGAVLVIGSHPHVIQPFWVSGSDPDNPDITLFSLGNFISNQAEPERRGGMSFYVELLRVGDQKTRYQHPAYLFHWVYTEWHNGRKRYAVLPSFMADTLIKETGQKAIYQQFVQNAREVIGNPAGISEILEF